MNKVSIIQFMNYITPYKGNFIESLEYMEDRLKKDGISVVYVIVLREHRKAAAVLRNIIRRKQIGRTS